MHLEARRSADTSLGPQLNTGACIGSAMLILAKRYRAPLASRHTWAFQRCLAEKEEI